MPRRGFTLVELVVSMIIIGIISIGLMSFGVHTSQIFVENKYRLGALEEARFVLTRFRRELANSLPVSPRILNDGRCMEYIPLLYVGEYVPENITLSSQQKGTQFQLSHQVNDSLAQCFTNNQAPCLVSIYPKNANDLYLGANADKQIYQLQSIGVNSITVKESLTRLPLSPSNRLFIYQPLARQFCAERQQIRFYPGYALFDAGIGANSALPSYTFAKGVNQSQGVFELGFNGTYSSTARMRFSLTLNKGKEAVEFMQNAQILNSQ